MSNPEPTIIPRLRRGEVMDRRTFRGKLDHLLRYIAATFFGLLFCGFLLGIPILLVITSTYGLGDAVRAKAEGLLGGKFYSVSIGRVLFSPTRGFILERLQIHDLTPGQRLIVSANRIAVSMNMDSLLRRNPRLERIFLRDATLDIPLGPSEQPRLRLDHVRGLIICPPSQFRLSSATFEIAGIKVNVSGSFLNPQKFSPKPVSSEGPGKTAQTIDAIQRELRSIHWSEGKPVLTIQAGGDLGDSESLRVDRAELLTGPGEWHGITFRRIGIELHYQDSKLTFDRLFTDDGAGIFQAAGKADFRAKNASLEFAGALRGSVLPALLLPHEKAIDWSCRDPLHLEGNFSADWLSGKSSLGGIARFNTGHFGFRGVMFDTISAGVALRDGKFLVRDLRASGEPGAIDADLMLAPGDNRLRIKASLFPSRFAPMTGGKTREAFEAMDFKEPLQINFEGGAPILDPLQLQGNGSLELGKAAMRGAGIDGLSSNFRVVNGAVTFQDILVRMGEGSGRGEFVYDYKNWEGLFPKVQSTLDPVKLMTWIDPRIAQSLKNYRFVKAPNIQLTGKVGLHDPEKNDLRIQLMASEGLGYTLIGKDLPFGPTSGTVLLKGQKLQIDLPRSQLFGGEVALKADVSVMPGDARYGASVHLENVDFKTLAKLYFDYNESSGKLTGNYTFRAVGGNDRAMTGNGNLLIRDGNVLAMPILGPLSLLLNDVIPGLGYQSAKKATADFSVADGTITTRNLLIEGTGFNMIGHGDIHYLDDRMDMSIRLNAQGIPGLATFLISKIFEYESTGSAKHPKWRPKFLPRGKGDPKSMPVSSPSN